MRSKALNVNVDLCNAVLLVTYIIFDINLPYNHYITSIRFIHYKISRICIDVIAAYPKGLIFTSLT
jgi:hypothetical protein